MCQDASSTPKLGCAAGERGAPSNKPSLRACRYRDTPDILQTNDPSIMCLPCFGLLLQTSNPFKHPLPRLSLQYSQLLYPEFPCQEHPGTPSQGDLLIVEKIITVNTLISGSGIPTSWHSNGKATCGCGRTAGCCAQGVPTHPRGCID